MLKFLTEKECRSLGIDPGDRREGQLTIKFMIVGGEIAVMWASPVISCDVLTKRLAVAMPKYAYATAPERQTFIYHLGKTWSVTDLEGSTVPWQRMFHDHARKALSRFVLELDRELERIDVSEDGIALGLKVAATEIAKAAFRLPKFDDLQPQLVVLCDCEHCSRPERPQPDDCYQLGYIPVYMSLPPLTHRHSLFCFAQRVIEAAGTTMLRNELARQKALLAHDVQTRFVMSHGPSIEA